MTSTTISGAVPSTDNPLCINLDSKRYSNICKRMAAHLKEQKGVELSHTQMRTAMSAALGFDSPNRLDALLKENDARVKAAEHSAGAVKDSGMQGAPTGTPERPAGAWVERQEAIKERLGDLIAGDVGGVAIDLTTLSISLLAQRYPATLSDADKQKIKENYPLATDALIAARAMSEEGVLNAVVLAKQASTIAIDYFAQSTCAAAKKQDEAHHAHVRRVLVPQLEAVFKNSVTAGMSPFGVATMMILTGAITGVNQGVHWTAMMRPLLEVVAPITKLRPRTVAPQDVVLSKEDENRILKTVMQEMGISRSTAKKYLAHAKEHLAEK